MNLHPLSGHEAIRRALAASHHREELPTALLLHGPPGVGKQRLALWIGQLLLCEARGEAGPCDACKSCRLQLRLEHPDFHWFLPLKRPSVTGGSERLDDALEEARWERLEEIRASPLHASVHEEPRGLYLGTVRNLRRRVQRRPSTGTRQVFLVAEAELLAAQESSAEAGNALLKSLEEPPEGTSFILTSNEPERLLPTIRSRSVQVHIAGLTGEEVEHFLTTVAEVEEETAKKAASLAQGSIGRAMGFVPGESGQEAPLDDLRRKAFRLVRAAIAPRPGERFLRSLDFPPAGGRGLGETLSFVESWLRDLAVVALGDPDSVLNSDARAGLEELVTRGRIRPELIPESLHAVDRARMLAAGNVNPQLIVHGLLHDLARSLTVEAP